MIKHVQKPVIFIVIEDCNDKNGIVTCTCKQGYSGDKCQTKGCNHLNGCSGHGDYIFMIQASVKPKNILSHANVKLVGLIIIVVNPIVVIVFAKMMVILYII